MINSSIVIFTVVTKCLDVVVDISFEQQLIFQAKGVVFFSCSKVGRKEVGTTVTIGRCVPIILCVELVYTFQSLKRKEEEEVEDRQKTICRLCRTIMNIHALFFAHTVRQKAQLLFSKH